MGWFSGVTDFLKNPATAFASMNPAAAIGSALSAGAQIGGSVYANQSSARQAAKQRDWEEEMSSTAHQREVADLRAAGLNPILSGTGGMGASTPSGSFASQSAPNFDLSSAFRNFADALVNTGTFERQSPYIGDKIQREMDLMDAQAGSARSYRDLNAALKEYNYQLKDYNEHLTQLVDEQAISERLKQKLLSQDVIINKKAIADALNDEQVSKTTFGSIMKYVDRLLRPLSGVLPRTSISR